LDTAALHDYLQDEGYPFPSARHYIQNAINVTRPDKILWGTDIPGLLTVATYRHLVRAAYEHTDFLSTGDQAKVLGGNAIKFMEQPNSERKIPLQSPPLPEPFVSRIATDRLTEFCIRAMTSVGMSEPDAQITADVLVRTDMRGIYTHGTVSLRRYIQLMRDGGIDPNAVPEVTAEGAGLGVDGCASGGRHGCQ
jgi:hypothetical protein